jgi:hypothetical protein
MWEGVVNQFAFIEVGRVYRDDQNICVYPHQRLGAFISG